MPKRDKNEQTMIFIGFDRPESNYFRMPNSWTDLTAGINSIAELKVVEYILRHTWGYHEYGIKKHITIDEFVHGRRRQDGERMDLGTGLSERAVYDGIRKAVEDGLIEEETDNTDRGRVRKSYSLRMRDSAQVSKDLSELQDLQTGVQTLQGVQSLHGRVQTLPARGAKSAPRSEKETVERINLSNIRKATQDRNDLGPIESEGVPERLRVQGVGRNLKQPESIAEVTAVMPLGEAIAVRQALALRGGLVAPVEATDDESRREASDRPRAPRRMREVPHQDEAYQVIQAYIADFSRELNDKAPLKTSTTRAYNLYKRAGLDQEAFIAQLYAARAVVKERTANIRSRGETSAAGLPMKHKAAYYFAVLEDLLGLRQEPIESGNNSSTTVANHPSTSSRTEPTSGETDGTLRSGWSKQRT